MKVDFDGLRQNAVDEYNAVISYLNRHLYKPDADAVELLMDASELKTLRDRTHSLKMTLVCLASLSGENETFGELPDDITFDNLDLQDE